jgi:hypothetical protein
MLHVPKKLIKKTTLILIGMSIFGSLGGSLFASTSFADGWTTDNDPAQFLFKDETLETRYNLLPKSGNVIDNGGHTPWSDTYWPDDDIGIAVRYTDKNGKITPQKHRSDVVLKAKEDGFTSLEQLRYMSLDEINALSPSEKFDIANGDYDYPLTRRVIAGLTGTTHYAYGICHGWSPASSNYPEPQPSSFTNKDGITIPFGASDVKGLISFYYAWEASATNENFHKSEDWEIGDNWDYRDNGTGKRVYWQREADRVPFVYHRLGKRCYTSKSECKDQTINPAALHLAVQNVMGRYHRSFEIDANNGTDLWNYPTLGYTTEEMDGKSIKPSVENNFAVSSVEVATDLFFADETPPQDQVTNGTLKSDKLLDNFDKIGVPLNKAPGGVDSRHLVYNLFLDQDQKIVGGEWKKGKLFASKGNRTEHVGFAWRASRVPFTGKYKVLNSIYKSTETSVNSFAASLNYTPNLKDNLNLPDSAFYRYIWFK